MKSVYFIIIFLVSFLSTAQQLALETGLDATVNETSGLLYLSNTLITHNDSATTNQLFDVDTSTGAVTRTVTITNASNSDWEDLTHDGTYIYIGDFGNYRGDRTNLKIYRIAIADYFASTSVTADIINFSYTNQTDFTPSPLATNFDAEGLIHYNNKLYVFSKNWLNGNTNIYELSKVPGTHSISMIDTISAQGLISGATYNDLNNEIVLIGYDVNGGFVIQLNGFNSGLFSNGSVVKTSMSVPANYSPQIEGIIPINANEYYVSAEENSPAASGLFSFNASTLSIKTLDNPSVSFYPNPAKQSITLSHDDCITKIYAITGQLVKTSSNKKIDISDLTTGVYLVKLQQGANQNSTIKRLIVQ
ncbi:T9SS type A sorting domain-containing protein [Winogradskyella sp.]|uniref:T9SS type A sorting domain-containing protein n=1 Tax=Winogradskyella sp. TaxID=1883156 RepID=UPI0025E37FF9|nr:T9SS type A sorting domain-containing protein [Winogradskyella sp.]